MTDNITNFVDQLAQQLKKADANIIFVNIDNLPMLILSYGHEKADEMLNSIAKQLGGQRIMSEQIFILTNAEPKKATREIKDSLNALDVHIASTITYRICKQGTDARDELSILYSQSMRQNTVFSISDNIEFQQNIDETRLHLDLAQQIKNAIRNEKFRLAFQPIVEAKTGQISHREALLRIVDDEGNLRSAGSFIPIAEKTGLIDAVDVRVLEMAIQHLKDNPEQILAVNISNLTIGNRDWIKRFFELITPEIGKRMVIEITETTALRDLKETAYFIATLQDTGCKFALDDFGSGYTSFRQIRALSFDYVKIDGSLVLDITTNPHNRLLVKSLLEYMQSLKIKTIAEFVENGETAKMLMELGIDYMQGNYFGRAA